MKRDGWGSGRMGEGRGSKEQNNGDKSTLGDKPLEGSTLWVLAKDNRNMRHGGISWVSRIQVEL